MVSESEKLISLSKSSLERYPYAEWFEVRKFVNHGEVFLIMNPAHENQPTFGTVYHREQVQKWANEEFI